MSASRRPWLKWNPSDWRADQAVSSCSLAARGLWLEMLGLMHEAEPYGHLMLNGQTISIEQLARLVRADYPEVESLIEELESVGVFSRDRKRQIYSRRMIRDEKKAKIGKKYAKQRWGQDTETIEEKPAPNGEGNGEPTETPMLRTKKEELREKKEPPIPDGIAPPCQPPPIPGNLVRKPKDGTTQRGTRLAPDWQPTDQHSDLARELGIDRNAEAAKFRDYWAAESGQRATKRDWNAAFRTWLRKAAEFAGRGPNGTGQSHAAGNRPGPGGVVAALDQLQGRTPRPRR